MNKRGFDCALPRALSFRRFSPFPSSILVSFSSYYPGSLHIFFLFFLVSHQVSSHLSFGHLPLTSLSDTPLHHEVQLRFARSKLIFILLVCIAKKSTLQCLTHAARCRKICIASVVGQIHQDKSNFGKTIYMYTRSRCIEGEWVFGGIYRETKACFFIVVGQRDKDTLLAIIHAHILPGTNVMSDLWRASIRLPKSEPQPKLTKAKHRCAHTAH